MTTASRAMILAALMLLASTLPLIDSSEADTEGRSAYELVLHDVLEPRETFVDQAGNTRNGLDVGDVVYFRPIIINDGDNNQTEFNIQVTVTPTADPSTLLIDTLDDAVCPGDIAVTGCSFNSLAPGAFLGGGNYRVQTLTGGDLSWSPMFPGSYTVTVSVEPVNTMHDGDLTNNDISFEVVVQHYRDIQVELCWLTGPGGDCLAGNDAHAAQQGAGPHNFAMMANVSGSESWAGREVTIDVSFEGEYMAAESSLTIGTGANSTTCQQATCRVVLGESTSIDVFHNISDPEQTSAHLENPCATNANPCAQMRNVATFGTVYTFEGVIKGDSDSTGGLEAFSVFAGLQSYVSYEAHEETYEDPSNPEAGTTTAIIMSEETMDYDDRTGNNADSLSGYFNVFHDVAITSLTGGENEATEGTLNVGETRLKASVIPTGSDEANLYDWAVIFSVKDETGLEMLGDGVSAACLDDEPGYDHMLLGIGMGAAPEGFACITVDLAPGRYLVTASVELIDDDPNCAPDCQEDMNAGNNMLGTFFEVINDNPTVYVTLDGVLRDELNVDPPVIVGDSVLLRARGADTETADEDLQYGWTRASALGGLEDIQCVEGPSSSICTAQTDITWIGERMIAVTVMDAHGASSSDSILLSVWNSYSTSLSVTGATMDYSLVFGPVTPYNVSAADADGVTDAVLTGFEGASYNSLVAFELMVSNVFSPDSIGGELLTVNIAGDASDPYDLWFMRAGGSDWTPLGAAATAGTNGVTLTYSHDGSEMPNMASGTYAVFATVASGGDPPATGITGLTPTLMPAARVDFTWSLSDDTAANAFLDSVYVYYCSGVGCDPIDGGEKAKGQITMDSFTLIGTDGEIYTLTVRAENSNGFNEDHVATSTVTADGSVSPAPDITDFVGGGNSADDGLSFSWSATDDSDVDSWMICWAASQSVVEDNFGDLVSAYQQNGDSCGMTEDTTTSLEISELTICGADCATKLYFGIAGVDDVGNVDSGSDKSNAMVAADFSAGVVEPPVIPGEEDKAESDAPEKAMYAIIALVVLAVIGGAFILTRGGGDEGEDKEWDY
jgi:hypothetical protein